MIFCDWMYALKIVGLSLDLLGQPMMAYFERLKSMCDHYAYLWSLVICGCMCCMFFVIITRSSTYAKLKRMY